MTLRVNHQKARFILVLSQQTAECCSSRSATATYIPTGWVWLPAMLPSQHISPPKPATPQHAPLLGQMHTPCAWMCLSRVATWSSQKPPSTAGNISHSPWEWLCHPSEVALAMLLVYSTPYSLCILLRCSANLGWLPAVKPNTADGSASRGKRSIYYPSR